MAWCQPTHLLQSLLHRLKANSRRRGKPDSSVRSGRSNGSVTSLNKAAQTTWISSPIQRRPQPPPTQRMFSSPSRPQSLIRRLTSFTALTRPTAGNTVDVSNLLADTLGRETYSRRGPASGELCPARLLRSAWKSAPGRRGAPPGRPPVPETHALGEQTVSHGPRGDQIDQGAAKTLG